MALTVLGNCRGNDLTIWRITAALRSEPHSRSARNSEPGATPLTMRSIPGAGTRDVNSLSFVDIVEFDLVSDRFDARLERQNVVITGHHRHSFEF